MYENKRIAVVVPAYKEEELIGRVIESMPNFIDKIIIVDDASPDRTFEIANSFKKQLKDRLTVIRHSKNQGVGGSIISGYEESLKQGIDIAVVMAGDGQMDPDDLVRLLEPLINGKVDYVKGNRLLTPDVAKVMPGIRYFGNSLLTILTKIASGYWHVMDPQCGYTAITSDTLRTIPFKALYKRFGFPNHILIMLNIYNKKISDVPVRAIYGKEKSKIRLRTFMPKVAWLLFFRFLWRLKQKYLVRDFHPLLLFYIFGFISTLLGLILGTKILFVRIFQGNLASVSTIVLCTFLLLTGMQSIFFAMWFDMEYNRRNEA